MTGTWINILTVLIGGTAGSILGGRLPEKLRSTVIAGLGLFTLAYGVSLFIKTQNALVVLGSLLVGALLGEWWQIEAGLQRLGQWLEKHLMPGQSSGERSVRFVRAFLTSSLVFCVGPMAILGAIQDGLTGDYNLLAVKAVLDGFAALAFASSLGAGVLFSALIILIYQGGLSLAAVKAQAFITPAMMTEMSAVGGLMLVSVAISSLLEIRPIRTGNFLPALVIAPLMVAILASLGVKLP